MHLNRERANAIMDREGLDCLFACVPNNVYYLSDFESDFLYDVPWVACAILPRNPNIPPCLVVTEIEFALLVERPTWMPEVRSYFFEIYDGVLPVHTFSPDKPYAEDDAKIAAMVNDLRKKGTKSAMGAVADMFKEHGLTKAKIGFDDTRFAAYLGGLVAPENVVDAGNLFLEIRMVKTPDEIAIMREAAKRNQVAIETAIGAIKQGATWQDIVTAYEVAVIKQQARPFATYNGAGRKSAGASRIDRSYTINQGDMVCFDSMMKYRRYMADCQRTAVLGDAPAKLETYWNAIKTGVDECYSAMKAGVSTADLRERALKTVRKNGIPTFELAFIHGIGLDHIEIPFVAGGKLGVFPLEAGMVINMDMEVHEIGFGGVFFEESMIITPTGAERMYTLPREMIRVRG